MRRGSQTPQQRFEDVIISMSAPSYTAAELAQLTVEQWMIDELAEAETAIRVLRHQLEARLSTSPRRCARCGAPIAGRSDRRFCSDRCRIVAHLENKRRERL